MSDQSVSAVTPVSELPTEQVDEVAATTVDAVAATQAAEGPKKTRRRLGGELDLMIPASRVKNVVKGQLTIFNLEYMKYEVRTPDTKTKKVEGETVDSDGKSVKVYKEVVHTHIPEKIYQSLRLGTEATLACTCMCELLAEWMLDYAVRGCISHSKKKVEVSHLYDNDISGMQFYNMISNCPNVRIEQNKATVRQFVALCSSNYSSNKDMLTQVQLCHESTQRKFEPFVVSEPAMFSKFILNIFKRMQQEAYYKDFMLTSEIKNHISVVLQWFLRMMTLTTLPLVESVENATFKINNILKAIKTALFFQNDTAGYNRLRTYVNDKMQLYYAYVQSNPKPVKAKKSKDDDEEEVNDADDNSEDEEDEDEDSSTHTPTQTPVSTPTPTPTPAPTPVLAATPAATSSVPVAELGEAATLVKKSRRVAAAESEPTPVPASVEVAAASVPVEVAATPARKSRKAAPPA